MKAAAENTTRPAVTFRLEAEKYDQLRERAKRNERTVSQEVRLLIREALDLEAEAA